MRLAAQQAQELETESSSASAAATSGVPAAAAAAVGSGVDVHGPISQADFLHGLGIQARFQALAEVTVTSTLHAS